MPEDIDHDTERMIVCHILKISGTMKKRQGPKKRKYLALEDNEDEGSKDIKGYVEEDSEDDGSIDYNDSNEEVDNSDSAEGLRFVKTRT